MDSSDAPAPPSGDAGPLPDGGAAQRYLELLKKTLTRSLFGDGLATYEPPKDAPERALWEVFCDYSPVDVTLVRRQPTTPEVRATGRDWPADAETMIGLRRLDNVHECVVSAVREGIPGDLLEAGVWRGGAAILMRAVLAAYAVTDRCVWVADSFQGLPPPDPERYPADADDLHWTRTELAVSVDDVRANFERYGLLDEQVRFLPGWFEETLAAAPIDQLAVLRIDGDMYGSTIVALRALYPKVADGGYVIVDDYGAIEGCRQAVVDFCAEQDIAPELHWIDWTGVYWRRRDSSPPARGTTDAVEPTAAPARPPPRSGRGRVGREFTVQVEGATRSLDVYSDSGFAAAADLYTRAGWHQELYKRTRWLGAPVWQLPEDLLVLQDLVWQVRPDVIVETGVMHGGSAIFFASLLELLGRGRVVAVDIRLSDEARGRVATHPVGHRVTLIEGSSTEPGVLSQVRRGIDAGERVLVVLDADHSYRHVRAELDSYAELVTPGSYVVVCDGVMEALADAPQASPAWERDNPARAAQDFLRSNEEFERDARWELFGATYFPSGFLRRSAADGSADGP